MSRVRIPGAAQRSFESLPITIKDRVLRVFERLNDWPTVSGAKPMSGSRAGQFRVRTGDYRVLFSVSGRGPLAVVTVEAVGHRDGLYDE